MLAVPGVGLPRGTFIYMYVYDSTIASRNKSFVCSYIIYKRKCVLPTRTAILPNLTYRLNECGNGTDREYHHYVNTGAEK